MCGRIATRRGTSQLEILVVCGVLIVLGAVFLPRLHWMRQQGTPAGPKSHCKNNLKQVGLALHSYFNFNGTLPPGWIVGDVESGNLAKQSAWGWQTMILPFADQGPLYQKLDPDHRRLAEYSDSVLEWPVLRMYLCPSAEDSSRTDPTGLTSYVGNFGVGIPSAVHVPEDLQGLFGCNSRVRFLDVKDGLTNVIMVGERGMSASEERWPVASVSGAYQSYWAGIPDLATVSPLCIVATVTNGEPATARNSTGGPDPLNRSGTLNGLNPESGAPALQPFRINRDHDGNLLKPGQVAAGFSSRHTDGAHVLLGDGSVRFLNNKIDPDVLANLMRRSDGVTLGTNWW